MAHFEKYHHHIICIHGTIHSVSGKQNKKSFLLILSKRNSGHTYIQPIANEKKNEHTHALSTHKIEK